MSESPQARASQAAKGTLIDRAVCLLSQQVWCWGRDIIRTEGNWLLKIGFARLEPPSERKDCSSVYTLDLPHGRCVVLRGFGVFFGDHARGGVFLPRYEFQPRFTPQTKLDRPPWSDSDLPKLREPTESQRASCASLTLELIDWIRAYEVNVVELLGIEYRRSTLGDWDDGKRPVILAEEMASTWRWLGIAIAEDLRLLFPKCRVSRSPVRD